VGGGGFIGVAACKELMRRGVETIAAGRKERPYGTFTSYIAFDRTDERELERALAQTEPDVLLDLACYQPQQIEAVAKHFHGQRYVFVSSGVYPPLHGRRAREEDFQPLDGDPPAELEYMDGKRWCETVLTRHPDLQWTVLRPPAVFGPADPSLRIAAYIQRIEDGGPVLVPAETYEWVANLAWVKDVGFACALASDPRKPAAHNAYNVAFENVTFRDVLEGIALALGTRANLHPIPFPQMPEGASPYGPMPSRHGGLDITAARRDLGFEPSALEDALAETLAWYRVARPSHPGYANRAREIDLARRD
jgi:nucleoside-diphosphate-sugar epimerase